MDEVQEEDNDNDARTPFQICGVLEGVWMQEQQEVSSNHYVSSDIEYILLIKRRQKNQKVLQKHLTRCYNAWDLRG